MFVLWVSTEWLEVDEAVVRTGRWCALVWLMKCEIVEFGTPQRRERSRSAVMFGTVQ